MRRALLLMGRPSAVFVGVNSYTSTTTSQVVTFPTGSQVGDLCVISCYYPNVSYDVTTPSGWTKDRYVWTTGPTYASIVLWKVLTSLDIATGNVTVAGLSPTEANNLSIVGYRGGPTSLTRRAAITGSSTTTTLPGFVKTNGNVRAVLVIAIDRDTGSSLPVVGGRFVARVAGRAVASTSCVTIADVTRAGDYPDNTNIVVTGFDATNGQSVIAYELA
jgi:hypothetical protein